MVCTVLFRTICQYKHVHCSVQLLHICIEGWGIWRWSEPFTVDNIGTFVRSIQYKGRTASLIIKVLPLNSVQKQVSFFHVVANKEQPFKKKYYNPKYRRIFFSILWSFNMFSIFLCFKEPPLNTAAGYLKMGKMSDFFFIRQFGPFERDG